MMVEPESLGRLAAENLLRMIDGKALGSRGKKITLDRGGLPIHQELPHSA